MKYIKKLSSKLLLALGVIILSVIVWQVIVSKRVIGDTVKIKQVQSIEQIHELLKTGELKTYHSIPNRPFSKIKLNGVDVQILKGNEYAVYVSDYCKRYVEVMTNEDELFLNLPNKSSIDTHNVPVLIFMPEDPQQVYCTKSYYFKIHGFKGENTLLFCEGKETQMRIITDMPYINVNQKDSYLDIYISGLDSMLKINHVQMNVHAENSVFNLDDRISDSINVDIQLQESVIGELKINSESKVRALSLQGTLLDKKDDYDYRNIDKMNINYPGQCDSLLIQLTSAPGNAKQLFLSKGLSGRFENIDCSDNVIIVRDE